jgi:TonB family protein
MPAFLAVQSWFRPVPFPLSRGALAAFFLLAGVRAVAFEAQPADHAKPDERTSPVAIRTVSPEHPPELRKKLINGEAEIECLITEQGHVAEALVISASRPEFGESALAAARQWEFKPAERNGTPVAIRVRIPFAFQMTTAQMLEALVGRPLFEIVSETIVPAEQLPAWPTPRQIILPRYPAELKGSGKYGKTVVSITINKEGKVINPKIVKYTYPEFVWPSLAAAVSLEFPPQMAGKTHIYVSMEMQFDFAAEGSKPKVAVPEIKTPPAPKKSGG